MWALRLLAFAEKRRARSPRALDARWTRELELGDRRLVLGDPRAQKALQKRLRKATLAIEAGAIAPATIQHRNAALLGAGLALDPASHQLLSFAASAHVDGLIQEAFWQVGPAPSAVAFELLAHVLGLDEATIEAALGPGSFLHTTGLVRLAECRTYDHREPLQLGPGLPLLFSRIHTSSESLLRAFFRPTKATRLGLCDFAHIGPDLDIIQRLLAAPQEGRNGRANVLLHGAPGTGKTELARAIAAALGATLFEVNVDDDHGDPLSREARLSACAVTQRMLAKRPRSLLLFDEIEDVFPHKGGRHDPESGRDKGFMVHLLEDTPVPTLWIGNHVSQIDPAFLRRFDYALELRAPPASVRRRLLEAALDGHAVTPDWLGSIAADARLTPAQIERSARVTRTLEPAPGRATESLFERVLASGLKLSHGDAAPRRPMAGPFDLSLLHADVDLDAVVRGLCRSRSGTLCLFGPPGTGKTAFGHHLASTLEVPVVTRRASDLLSKWVGETEQGIRDMFDEARRERALLLLDEADSFFRSRARAANAWEVTQVNELLVELESFEGLFVCTTNLFDDVDEAALRRFTLKIRFQAMTADQRWRLFDRTLQDLQSGAPRPPLRADLDRLDCLTPGDFAVVARRLRLLDGPPSAEQLLEGLARETAGKPGRSRELGFLRRH